MNQWISILVVFILSFGVLSSQEVVDTTKNLSISAFPIVYFLPESGFGFGGVAISTFRFKGEAQATRPSSFQLGLTYTQKRQILVFLPFELYLRGEDIRLEGELGFYKYFYNHFGIGPHSREEDLEIFDVTFPRFRLAALQRYEEQPIHFGLTYQYDYFNITRIEEGGLLDTNRPTGYQGGILSNIGVRAIYDTRDNIFLTYKGTYIIADMFIGSQWTGSSFNYQKISLDARHFIQLDDAMSIGFQVVAMTQFGNVPFFDLNYLGTPTIGRGINDRRFKDRSVISSQVEYRYPIYRRFSGVAFSTVNWVGKDLFGGEKAFIPTVGAGIRINVNKQERTQVRIDAAYSREGINFYATASSSF